VLSLVLLSSLHLWAQTPSSVTLAWDPSPNATVVDYKVYYGVATKVYTNAVDAGPTNVVTITNLASGIRYYFAATAIDNLGQESAYSVETNYVLSTGNGMPTITAIGNQAIVLDTTTIPLPFQVGDSQTPAANLTLSANANNAALVAPSGIVFGGAGSDRTVTVTPLSGASGNTLITVTVSDGTNSASTSFQLIVLNSRPANTPPTITAISAQVIAENTVGGPLTFYVGDAETAASSLVVTASSSDQTLVPNGNIVLGGAGGVRTVTVTPSAGLVGAATITLSVSDGSASTNTSFLLTVETPTYSPMAASFNGLFYESNNVEFASAGSIKLSTTVKSSYSGQVKHQGKTYSVSGKLDALGRGSNSIARAAQSSLVLLFTCGPSNSPDVMTGTLSGPGWQAFVSADRLVFNSRTNPAPWAGSYTVVLPGQNVADGPVGHGYGTVKVTTSGGASFAGSLGDGTRVSQSTLLSKEGMWPFYVSLYSSKGLVISWLSVSNNPDPNVPDVAGLTSWIKLADPTAHYYPTGFTNQCEAAGSIFIKPVTTTIPIVHLDNGHMRFAGGNLTGPFTNVVDIVTGSKVVNGSTNALSMSFSLTSGAFTGHVLDPFARKSKSFGGVVLQKFSSGYGTLVGTNLTSDVELTQ